MHFQLWCVRNKIGSLVFYLKKKLKKLKLEEITNLKHIQCYAMYINGV